jgi:hypothetical protein
MQYTSTSLRTHSVQFLLRLIPLGSLPGRLAIVSDTPDLRPYFDNGVKARLQTLQALVILLLVDSNLCVWIVPGVYKSAVRFRQLAVIPASHLRHRPQLPSSSCQDRTCPCLGTSSAYRAQDLFRKPLHLDRR